MTTEHFQRFARRTQTALLQVFSALPDSLTCIRLRRDIQQALRLRRLRQPLLPGHSLYELAVFSSF
jgi:hypothetical protein